MIKPDKLNLKQWALEDRPRDKMTQKGAGALTNANTGEILFADLPVKVVLKVTYTEPGLKGDTATNATKPAKVETGCEVRVPLFINEGELIEVDTRDGSYQGRVKA